MFLSGVLITHQLSDEATRWFADMRSVVDELVAFVDEDRAAPDLHAKLTKLDARILNTRAPEFYRADFGAMVAACRGDWLLKIDYDEELSPEWHDRRWREVVEQSEFTHFWSPRRWLTAPDKFIACEPWWPDRQLRLFRNQPAEITFPTQLHDTMQMNGPGGYLRTLAIHHHDLRLASRAAREAKAAAYEQQRPGKGLGFFYLHEDYDLPLANLPTTSAFDSDAEILRMPKLSDAGVAQLQINLADVPRSMRAGELCWLDVGLTNGSDAVVQSGAPFPLNMAYHWLDASSRSTVVYDGERTAILPPLQPDESSTFKMFVTAPATPGTYLLRLTVVQEHARWLDAEGSPTARDFRVNVIAET